MLLADHSFVITLCTYRLYGKSTFIRYTAISLAYFGSDVESAADSVGAHQVGHGISIRSYACFPSSLLFNSHDQLRLMINYPFPPLQQALKETKILSHRHGPIWRAQRITYNQAPASAFCTIPTAKKKETNKRTWITLFYNGTSVGSTRIPNETITWWRVLCAVQTFGVT